MTDIDHRSIGSARRALGRVVHDAANHGLRTVIRDGGDSAVVVSPGDLEDLEDTVALRDWRRGGSPTVGTLEESADDLGIVIPGPDERAA
jgi:hypothetical protein